MARVKLTKGRIDGLQCPADKPQVFLRDAEVPSLAVRATPSGEKAFVFEAKLAGKSLRMTIGSVVDWDIEKARQQARSWKTLVDAGRDPREVKAESIKADEAKRKERKRADATLSDLWAEYLAAEHAWGARHRADHEAIAKPPGVHKRTQEPTMAGPLYGLMDTRLVDLDSKAVTAWLSKHTTDRPTQAALAFRLLRALIRWSHEQRPYAGLVPDSALDKSAKAKVPKAKAKGDVLQREQVAPWFDAVLKISNPTISSYLQIVLLTGARREELSSLKWEHVDLKWNTMTLRDKAESKGGEDGMRKIPITPYVATLLANLKARNDIPPPDERIVHGKRIKVDISEWTPSPWVFPSKTSATGRLVEPRLQHVEALRAAGLPHVSLHGLRRSFASLSEWAEVPAGVVAQIMGHKPSALAEKHYRVRPLDLLRAWHVKIEAWILQQAGIKQPSAKEAQPASPSLKRVRRVA